MPVGHRTIRVVNLALVTSANVRRMMAERRATQVDVAAVLGIRQSQVSRRLHASVPFTLHDLELLAEHFDTPAADLVTPATDEPTAVAS